MEMDGHGGESGPNLTSSQRYMFKLCALCSSLLDFCCVLPLGSIGDTRLVLAPWQYSKIAQSPWPRGAWTMAWVPQS